MRDETAPSDVAMMSEIMVTDANGDPVDFSIKLDGVYDPEAAAAIMNATRADIKRLEEKLDRILTLLNSHSSEEE